MPYYPPASSGGGDVSKVGTPANNEIGVWTGDGTIEGDSNFVWDGSVLSVTGDAKASGNWYNTIDTGSSIFSGGNSASTGANFQLFGGTHATRASDFEFRADTTVIWDWDESASELTLTEDFLLRAGVYVDERAAARTDKAGYGQYWVLTATPNEPWFTNDAGNDYPIMLGGKHTVYVPAGAMYADPTSFPVFATGDSGTNDRVFPAWSFDNTADEIVHFNVWMPKSYNGGTVSFKVVWYAASAVTTGVAFALQATSLGDNHDIDAAWGTAVVVTDDAQGTATQTYITDESAALTISGAAAEELVSFRLYRDVSDANDDLAEDALVLGLILYITYDAGNDV